MNIISGKWWTSKEAMRDEHKKRFNQYECTHWCACHWLCLLSII